MGKKFFTSCFPKKTDNASVTTSKLNIYRDGWNSIASYPPTTKARGKPASIIALDELAFWCDYTPDEYKIYGEVVRPIITDEPNTKLFCATTPNGARGLAYELLPIDGHKTPYTLIWFGYTIRQDDIYLAEMEKLKQEYIDQGRYDEFRQEYLAEIVNKTNAYFDKEKEIDNVLDERRNMELRYTGEVDVGLDFGGSVKSRTVITVSRYNKERKLCERIYHKRYEVGKDSTLQADIVTLAVLFPNIRRWHIDSQGGGSAFYDWFDLRFGRNNIDQITFKGRKADMYRLFKIACYQNRIKSYYDPVLLDEFLNFTSDLKPAKHSTDDLLDSFVMSCIDWLEEKETQSFKVIIY